MGFNNDRLLVAALLGSHPGPESSIGKLLWANWHRGFGKLMVDLMGPDAMVVSDGYRLDPMQHSFLIPRRDHLRGGQRNPAEHCRRAGARPPEAKEPAPSPTDLGSARVK